MKHFPEFLDKIEAKLNTFGKKYLVSDTMSLADIYLASHLFKLPYNDTY